MKKCLTRIVTVMICLAVVMSFSTTQVNAASKKPGKVKASSIKYLGTDSNTSTMAFTWKKVKGAKGYQVRIIDARSYKKSGAVVQYLSANCKKNNIKLNTSSLESEKAYLLQVRAFKNKGKRKVYGKWSTGPARFKAESPYEAPVESAPRVSINTSITATPQSATIRVGETTSFFIRGDRGGDMKMEFFFSGINFRIEDEIGKNGIGIGDAIIYVTGTNESTNHIFIYDPNNENANTLITVNVIASDADPDAKPYIDPDYNTSITVDKPYIKINQGETAQLEVYTDKGTDIYADWYKNDVDFNWGDWFGNNNKNRYAYITGTKKGCSLITICDENNYSVKTVIPVIVK